MYLLADCFGSHKGDGCQLLIVTVLQNGVALISCIDFYVIHLLAGSQRQESIQAKGSPFVKSQSRFNDA